jgi:tRNA 2-thiouridine synthesizing protein B
MALVMVKEGRGNIGAKMKLVVAREDDDIVLIQDGVYWMLEQIQGVTKGRVSVLKEDLIARGYTEDATSLPIIDYGGLVELIEKHERFIG